MLNDIELLFHTKWLKAGWKSENPKSIFTHIFYALDSDSWDILHSKSFAY